MNVSDQDSSSLSISQVARRFGVSLETIRRWEKAGLLHAIRPDGKNRIFQNQEVEELLQRQPLTASAAAEFLGISTKRLKEITSDGDVVPAGHGGATYVYTKDQLEKLKNSIYIKDNYN